MLSGLQEHRGDRREEARQDQGQVHYEYFAEDVVDEQGDPESRAEYLHDLIVLGLMRDR